MKALILVLAFMGSVNFALADGNSKVICEYKHIIEEAVDKINSDIESLEYKGYLRASAVSAAFLPFSDEGKFILCVTVSRN